MKRTAVALGVVVGMAMGLGSSIAVGQERIMIAASVDSGSPGGSSGKIAKSAVEKYAKLLGFSEDQKSTAMALHDGYDAAYMQAMREFSAAMEEMRRASEESDDRGVFMERMPKARKEMVTKTKDLEKGFMADMKSLATPEQEAKWGKVERQRRREVLLRPGGVSGEGVNLLETVEGLKLPADVRTGLAEAMESYEADIDRVLMAKQRVLDEQPEFEPGRGLDIEAFQKQLAKTREAGIQVREVNSQYQRRIEVMLPEEKRASFNDAVKRATYPTVYRANRVSRQLDAATKFEDLTTEQRESLANFRESFERDLGAANDRLAGEIDAAEKKGQSGGQVPMVGGGQMSIRFGDEDDTSPLAQARKAKRELEETARKRLETILTKEQRDRLPKEPAGGGQVDGPFISGDAVRIVR